MKNNQGKNIGECTVDVAIRSWLSWWPCPCKFWLSVYICLLYAKHRNYCTKLSWKKSREKNLYMVMNVYCHGRHRCSTGVEQVLMVPATAHSGVKFGR